jgi:hypothetical protein
MIKKWNLYEHIHGGGDCLCIDDPAPRTIELCEYEVNMLRQMAGQIPAQPWGAAVGAVLEILSGQGYIARAKGKYDLTPKGRAELVARGFT